MDTSETYIKMCEKAEEIQPKLQPFHMMVSHSELFYDDGDVWFAGLERHLPTGIVKVWLPRQDQLQEMLEWTEKGRYGVILLDAFYHWAKDTFNPQPWGDDSMSWEQLWLAFVMKEKYSKVWDGENWVG